MKALLLLSTGLGVGLCATEQPHGRFAGAALEPNPPLDPVGAIDCASPLNAAEALNCAGDPTQCLNEQSCYKTVGGIKGLEVFLSLQNNKTDLKKEATCLCEDCFSLDNSKAKSPPISWSTPPEATKSMVIMVRDLIKTKYVPVPYNKTVNQTNPKNPNNWTLVNISAFKSKKYVNDYQIHWLLWNIPYTPETNNIPAGVIPNVPDGSPLWKNISGKGNVRLGNHGMTDYGKWGYAAPCPPHKGGLKGHHTFRFTVWAIDVPSLDLKDGASVEEVIKACNGKVVGQGFEDVQFEITEADVPTP